MAKNCSTLCERAPFWQEVSNLLLKEFSGSYQRLFSDEAYNKDACFRCGWDWKELCRVSWNWTHGYCKDRSLLRFKFKWVESVNFSWHLKYSRLKLKGTGSSQFCTGVFVKLWTDEYLFCATWTCSCKQQHMVTCTSRCKALYIVLIVPHFN